MSDVRLDGIDLTDLDRFANGFPHDVFTVLRRVAPVWWHEPTVHTPDGEGFWSVHTHAECMAVVHDPEAFSSETGGERPFGGTIIPDLPVAGQVLNMMDDPRHHEQVFDEPFRFDVRREPNPHLGFGHGIHHCLGASLARLEIRVVMTELLARVDTIELAGAVEWTRSNKHTGIRRLPVRLTPAPS